MNLIPKYTKAFKYLLPAPFTIAVCLTFIVLIIAFGVGFPEKGNGIPSAIQLLKYWEEGLWNQNLIVFAMQMMLMLVLGHTLALTKPINSFINWSIKSCNTTSKAAAIITFFTIIISLFNWGLGLIFGAIFARKVGEHANNLKIEINYPLIGAAGYSGLMVWHGGLSGSSLSKVAEAGHIKQMMLTILTKEELLKLPESISYQETFWSSMNIFVMGLLVTILPLSMYWLGKKVKPTSYRFLTKKIKESAFQLEGAEKIDHSRSFSFLFGSIILGYIIYKISVDYSYNFLSFLNPNNINLLLFGLTILLHKNIATFLNAIDKAIGGASGILIQFPLYFGIMGIMNSAGLIGYISNFFVSISNETTYPIFTFISAGVVNIFIPSGGGQWALQGPVIIQAANDLGIPFSKSILALAYGDQVTNMLQPFWALPLLGITKLKAKEILPFTLYLMGIGTVIYLSALLLF